MLTIPNNPFDFNRKGNSTRFPSVDSAFSFKSRNSKLLLTLDQSDQSSTNSLIKTFNSPISLSKKKVRISLALNHENEYMIPGNGFSSFKGMYTSNLKEKIEERRSLQIKKHLNIKLEEIKRKSKKSVFSTDNYSDSKTLGDKFSKIPSYILDNKLKIVHAAQMKEPLIVLECYYYDFCIILCKNHII